MNKFIFSVAFLLIALGASWLTPWSRPQAMVTVTGEAKQQISNQVAHFNVTVTETNKDKETATNAVNQAMDEITKSVKEFGIEEKDLTTQNVSVYQVSKPEILIYPPRPRTTGDDEWQANNTLSIILREVDRASALTDLLQGFAKAQVSGPSFTVDDTQSSEIDLMAAAMADAREKAERLAEVSNRRVGKVLTVNEGYSSQPYPVMYRGLAEDQALSSVAAPVQPGSTQMSKTLTVVFELK